MKLEVNSKTATFKEVLLQFPKRYLWFLHLKYLKL